MFHTSRCVPAAMLLAVLITGLLTREADAQKSKRAGEPGAEQSVTKLEQQWFVYQLAFDWEKLNRMIADDFVLTESDGKLGNRQSMLDGYKAEAASTSNIKMTFLATHAVANNAVVATGLDDITLKDKEGRVTHRYERFTDVWIFRGGRWQCVAEQLTLSKP
jgi:hypothetical protein